MTEVVFTGFVFRSRARRLALDGVTELPWNTTYHPKVGWSDWSYAYGRSSSSQPMIYSTASKAMTANSKAGVVRKEDRRYDWTTKQHTVEGFIEKESECIPVSVMHMVDTNE